MARWTRFGVVPSLMMLAGGLSAADDARIREHTLSVVDLINAELRLPAERAVSAFDAAGYDDPGSVWMRSNTTSLGSSRLARHLRSRASTARRPSSSMRLQPQLADMPDYLQALVDKKGLVPRLSAKDLEQNMNPDLPPPLVDPTPSDIASIQGLYTRLLESADVTIEAQLA